MNTFVVLKFDHGTDRAKDFLLHYFHVSVDAGEKRWLDIEAIFSFLAASAVNLCTFILTGLDITHNALSWAHQMGFNITLTSDVRRIEF